MYNILDRFTRKIHSMKSNNIEEVPAVIEWHSSIWASIWYALATKTNIKKVFAFEKNSYTWWGNSAPNRNSQSLHVWRMEQYSHTKAEMISQQAQKTIDLCLKHIPESKWVWKMVDQNLIGIGEKADLVRARYDEFKNLFPDMQLLERDELSAYEPIIMAWRDPKQDIVVMHSKDIPAVNFWAMAQCLKELTDETRKGIVDVFYNTKVVDVDRDGNYWYITLNDGKVIKTKYYINATSGNAIYDLLKYWNKYPQENMLYGDKRYLIEKWDIWYSWIGAYWVQMLGLDLHNKFYQPQKPWFPMAEFHIDPKIGIDSNWFITWGPTAYPTLLIEPEWDQKRDKFWTLTKSNLNTRSIATLMHILTKNNFEYSKFMMRQMAFNIPYFGNKMLLDEVRKFIPSATMDNLKFPKIPAWIRVQEHANKKIWDNERWPLFGSGIYHTEDMTWTFINSPSPWASVSVHIWEEIAKWLCEASKWDIQWLPKKQMIMSA